MPEEVKGIAFGQILSGGDKSDEEKEVYEMFSNHDSESWV